MQDSTLKNLPLLQVLAGASLISFSSIMVRLSEADPTAAGVYRVLFGGIALLAGALIRRENLWMGAKAFFGAAAAGLFFCFDMVFWHRSIHYVGPGLATLIANFQVFLVAAAGVLFFKEKVTTRLIFSIITALAGLYLIVAQDWAATAGNYRAGVLLGLLAALSYTFYLFALRRTMVLPVKLPLFANMAIMSLVSALFLYITATVTGESLAIPRPVDWLWLLIYGLVCHSLGWILIGTGMPRIPPSKTGLILLMQPTLAFIWDILIFARPTTAIEALGAVITLGAIYLGAVRR
ncbi:DMT family transporter [Dethiosulfatarculus sandiegensis]|uniref:EamA domain-containing protein n=1 Tax=Dethiosulfatarculus sandiegensis TaxID=1429043 RepID=A0A0D2J309_9BACT|nr:DMT family transporter [Dethiosulfatarculus sandiegensis]KIX12554.1 hypothetical protein X474_18290 [Dethiosulfatarculus sandiegensis]